jgi:rod shape-determining protein MreD
MMSKMLPSAVVLVGAFILQAGLASYLSIGGVTPNFMLLVVITLALVQGPRAGATIGFIAGLLFDLLGSGAVGPMALVLTLTGYTAGMLHAAMFAEGWLLPLTVVGVGSLLAGVAYGLVLALLGSGGAFWTTFFLRMLPGAVYNTVLALLFFPWLARFLRHERPMNMFRRMG